jgi:hypothetical protein
MADLALEPIGGSPAQLQELLAAEAPRWSALVRSAGIRAE